MYNRRLNRSQYSTDFVQYKILVTLYFTTRKQLCKYTEITVYISVIIVYFSVGIREQYVKFWVIKW